jgi:GAF domain-containing protein
VVANEAQRLRDLREYRILDTKPEQAFDDLTLIASQICGVPIALISPVDEERQWFKSRVGVETQETMRSVSFCARAIHQQGIFTVADALNDARFRDNPLVQGDPHIRFYAGARSQRRMATPLERSA